MKRLPLGILTLLVFAGGVQGQELIKYELPTPEDEHGQDHHWCATPHHLNSEEGRAALDRFFAARDSGTLPKTGRTFGSYQIGQSATFNVIEDSNWTAAEFELRQTGVSWRAWIRTDGQGDQHVITQSRLEQMRVAFDETTPASSIDPSKGIFENDVDIFGDWPVYPDGSDGIVDVLIYSLDPGVARLRPSFGR